MNQKDEQPENQSPEQEALDEEAINKAAADGVPLEELLEADFSPPEVSADAEIEKLQAEIEDWKDKALRAVAEEENTRSRFAREKADLLKYAQAPLATEIFAVADILGKAIESIPQEWHDKAEMKGFIEGLQFTQNSLEGALQKFHIQKIGQVGDKFDSAIHQAVSIAENTDAEPNSIVEILQPGYMLHDRILRAAMVVVSKA